MGKKDQRKTRISVRILNTFLENTDIPSEGNVVRVSCQVCLEAWDKRKSEGLKAVTGQAGGKGKSKVRFFQERGDDQFFPRFG